MSNNPNNPNNPIIPPVEPAPYRPTGHDPSAWSNEVFPGPSGGAPGHSSHSRTGRPKPWRKLMFVAICVLSFLVGCGVGAAMQAVDENASQEGQEGASAPLTGPPVREVTPTPVQSASKPASVAPTKPPAPKPSDPEPVKIGNGVHQVGVDIDPGRYKTTGPDQDSFTGMCYWTRLKNDTGEFGAIIANDLVEGAGSLTVKSSDKFVEFSGDCTWVKQ